MNGKSKIIKDSIFSLLVTLLACTVAAITFIALSGEWTPYNIWYVFMVSYSYGVCVCLSIDIWNRFFPERSLLFRYSIPSVLGFILGTLLQMLILYYLYDDKSTDELLSWLNQGLLYSILANVVIIFYFYNQQQKITIQEELKVAQLQQAAKEKELLHSQLRLLQSQIEPHFLFNTLANLKALIILEPSRATVLLDNLTALLRQSLKQSEKETITLKDELKFCESYIAIQQIRLDDRISVNINVSANVNQQQPFLPLLLQPIVENAILHGIEPAPGRCALTIEVQKTEADVLEIMIEDDGVGLGNCSHKGNGVGLKNVRNRLQSFYGDDSQLSIMGNRMGGVSVLLNIPAEM
ncbi:sensor histidine kinase [Photobacterium lipolyticum]|uniref:Sensor histidine kinase n=1 Tax=Photobacterium lipolyticum TaxID=266810 RepID=A0A2T3MZ70_9GAMM|nr:histidine kinase [Photobacterium lipolyticum]PSW05236.1 sensor histidine kinase [Photobacterium lipolyticum]